ncbi:hypothetical protein [Brevundimonas sp.]|uniref:hypothetical protein n=1 Tax=Brevundimonas sp. TaxID=1871086 RepID=UPI00289DB3CF|nr:hypothetical protein [Brevundimonas sp.]
MTVSDVLNEGVKERPILFSGPMVRALLDGRKTQTRRVVKPMRKQSFLTPELLASAPSVNIGEGWAGFAHPEGGPLTSIRCPYGKPGDRLWVRETVACGACAGGPPSHWSPSFWRREQGTPANRNGLWYAADDLSPEKPITERGRWVPGIHMPRWACRLVLEITDVRVERLLDCSDADAQAEGLQWAAPGMWSVDRTLPIIGIDAPQVYFELWNHINGAGAAEANPWVWAVSFRVLSDDERQAARQSKGAE